MNLFSRRERPQKAASARVAPQQRPGTTLQPDPAAAAPPPQEPRPPRSLHLSYQAANLQGIGTCERQEDSFAFANALDVRKMQEKGLLAIVADGMGGMRDGKLASDTAVRSVKTAFDGFDYEQDLAIQLCKSFIGASGSVYQALEGEGGSTMIACILYQERLWFASVGDSYLLLKRGGELIQLNRPQNVLYQRYMELIRAGHMDASSAREDREKAAITQFLGVDILDDIDYLREPLPLLEGDVLLICSDGVGGVLSTEQIIQCLSLRTPKEMCTALEQNVLATSAGRYQDNFTALVIQCSY